MKKGMILLGLFALFTVISQVSAFDLLSQSPNQTFFSKEIPLSPKLESIVEVMFNLPDNTGLTIQSLVLLTTLVITTFILFNSALIFSTFSDITRLIVSGILAILAMLTGALYKLYIGLVSAGTFFDSLSSVKGFGFVFPLVLMIIILIIISSVLKLVKNNLNKNQAGAAGYELGKQIGETKMYSTIFRDVVSEAGKK